MDICFVCIHCGKSYSHPEAKLGCFSCKQSMFKVARTGILPLINEPQQDLYRQHGDNLNNEQDGYKFTTPGDSGGDIGDAGLGTSRFRKDQLGYDESAQNLYVPSDNQFWGGGDERDDDNNWKNDAISNKELLIDNESGENPLSRSNDKMKKHIGIQNMHEALPYLQDDRKGNLFERMRTFMKKQKG